jgi:formylglycine-generating enzyme required for sulfatase activity
MRGYAMRRDLIRLKAGLTGAVIVIVVGLPSTKLLTNGGVSMAAPQGKGGEVIAKPKPTPTPKKTTPPARTNRISSRPLPRTHTNQAGIEFVLIPPGSFRMGSLRGDANEKPVHQVTIGQAFYMGKYVVTQAQWQSVMGTTTHQQHDKVAGSYIIVGEGDNYPMYFVSWEEATSFVQRLNAMNDGYSYRLPTEAEWEYACRAGTKGDYYADDVNDIGWSLGNSGDKTHAVGGKQPNAFGLYDMSGNVSEWCRDVYHDNYYGAPTNGSAWVSGGDSQKRVLRGGGWFDRAVYLRSAARFKDSLDYREYDIGFRVVATVPNQ